MPSKKQYNLVHNDEYDTRIPLHSEEAFHRGIVFHAKFIGSMEVPRPTSRMEIVAAMRRIRFEFKAKGIKKKKVTLEVSVDGLKVTLRKKKKKQNLFDESKLVIMHHPIYRIFYVSHDSHDLKIFSYIARDSSGNSFRCNVFKSSKKSQAMRVVRTVGQAFEVCHKLSLNNPAGGNGVGGAEDQQQQIHCNEKDRLGDGGENQRSSIDEYDERDEFASIHQTQPSPSSLHKDISLLGDAEDSILDQPCPPSSVCPASPVRRSPLSTAMSEQPMNGHELTTLKHEIQLVRERLEQQSQQTRAAVAHARLLQDQLAAETAARVEAQARTHQLLVQNKELLEHIAALVSHLREQERASGLPSLPGLPIQVSSANALTQGTADLVGQYKSAWESLGAYPAPYYPGYGWRPSIASHAEELRYQQQLWESLRLASPFAQPLPPQPPPMSPVFAPTPTHYLGPGFNLPPTGRMRAGQVSSSPSPSPARGPSSRPDGRSPSSSGPAQPRSRSLERPAEASFIKPLPCTSCSRSPRRASRSSLHELTRPLVLDAPPALPRPEHLSPDSMPRIPESPEPDDELAHPRRRRNSR